MDLYELIPWGKKKGAKGIVLNKKRILLGSSVSCDVVLRHKEVAAIHAIIEIMESKFRVYDMNSECGTFVNGNKVVAHEFIETDVVSFGPYEFVLKKYSKSDTVPPILDMLNPELPPKIKEVKRPDREPPKEPILKRILPKKKPRIKRVREIEDDIVPKVEYPLSIDPKAEFSEYIFEDHDNLYPIFRYQYGKSSIEVIILYKDQIFSVDYLPKINGVFHLVGYDPHKDDIEHACLSKNERIPFVEIQGDDIVIYPIEGHKCLFLAGEGEQRAIDGKSLTSSIFLDKEDILRFSKGDVQIFIRATDAPPYVKPAPFFRRDSELKKYIFIIITILTVFVLSLNYVEIDEEKDKEKNPERIASILYKKEYFVSKTKRATKDRKLPQVYQKVSSGDQEKKVMKKTKDKVPKKVLRKKVTKKTAPIKMAKKVKEVRPKRAALGRKKVPVKKSVKKRKYRRLRPRKTTGRGHVDSYKSYNFKDTISSLLAKGASTRGLKTGRAQVSDSTTPLLEGRSGVGRMKRADVSKNIGSMEQITRGRLDTKQGTGDLVSKRRYYTVGVPSQTIILGSMDPDVIRRILMDHIPQFRYCYQRALDQSSKSFDGIVPLDFIIGASGRVSKAGISSTPRNIPISVQKCVINVLKGIQFPRPLGGGVVSVKQPMNFYPVVR